MTRPTPLPPDFDLNPSARARQRDELIAVVDHEAAQSVPRRRVAVPLLAAASVAAVVAGLAFAVPALQGDDAQPQVAGPAAADAAKPAVKELTAAEKKALGAVCGKSFGGRQTPTQAPKYTVTDGFRWVDPPAKAQAIMWVTIKSAKMSTACGFNAKGQRTETALADRIQRNVVDPPASNRGTYTKGVTRITIAIGQGPATEAVLRNGFFFAPLPYVSTYDPKKPWLPPAYTVRAYDAAGKKIFETPAEQAKVEALLNTCYTDPKRTRIVYSLADGKAKPPISACPAGVAWTW
jgi:hypothetical protein